MSGRLKVMPKQPLEIVCCLIFDKQNRLLLLQRHVDDLGGGLWATPGGRQEPDELPEQTAVREVKEETGLDLDAVTYLGNHKLVMPHGVAHMKSFKAHHKGNQEILIDRDEHKAYLWLGLKDILGAENIIWGLPTTLLDFGLIESLETDPTLKDGSQVLLLELATSKN